MSDDTAERIRAVEEILDYEFQDKSILLEALGAAGATAAREGNKPIALIGDAVLRLDLYEVGYYNRESIFEMTNAQNTRATKANLARVGFSLHFDLYIYLNPSARGYLSEKGMATLVEAIIGAVYRDSNKDLNTIHRLLLRLRIIVRE